MDFPLYFQKLKLTVLIEILTFRSAPPTLHFIHCLRGQELVFGNCTAYVTQVSSHINTDSTDVTLASYKGTLT